METSNPEFEKTAAHTDEFRKQQEERLRPLLTGRFEDLKFADTKAGVVLTFAGALATGVPALDRLVFPDPAQAYGGLFSIVGLLGFVSALFTVWCAMRAIQPRRLAGDELLNDRWIPGKNPFGGPPSRKSPHNGTDQYLSSSDAASYESAESFRLHFDSRFHYHCYGLIEEFHRMSGIAYVKHRWIHRAVVGLGFEATFFLSFVGLKLLLLKKAPQQVLCSLPFTLEPFHPIGMNQSLQIFEFPNLYFALFAYLV